MQCSKGVLHLLVIVAVLALSVSRADVQGKRLEKGGWQG